jgi:signal transduction histidine kinase
MKYTPQMAKSGLVAGCLSDPDATIEDLYPLARAVITTKITQSSLAPAQAELAYAPRPMTLDELTASIVHEVIQPLATIVMNGDACLRWLGRDEPRLEEARAAVAAMIRGALRSSDIVRRLRALSTKADVQRLELNLNEVIEEVVPLIEPEALCNRVLLRLNLASDLPLVLGDRVQLQQVIINLLANGIQAMASVSDRSRELLIRSKQYDVNHVGIIVQDNGTGIGPDDMDRLFNTFFTTKANGMGIGLSICRSIIEAHGGLISASSNTGQGATFYFALPAIRPMAA